ncbi:MAG: WD40/YVTN/BNR-like repeat-containing protein, partial [Thermoanaerobaculia bacterium]
NRIWVTHRTLNGGRVWRSDNGGASWIDRTTAALPNLPINALEVDPANANRVWVGADVGVYQSTDGGASWTNFSSSLPNVYVGDLSFHPHARVLRAGTRNRGVWEIPVDGWMTNPICGVQFTGTVAANATQRWFAHSWPAVWNVLWTVMPTTLFSGGQEIGLTVQVERPNAEFVTYWLTVRNYTAAPVAFEGRFCILSRY